RRMTPEELVRGPGTDHPHAPWSVRRGGMIGSGATDQLLWSHPPRGVPVGEPVAVHHRAERVHAAAGGDAAARMRLARTADGIIEQLENLAERARLRIDDGNRRWLRAQRIVRIEPLGGTGSDTTAQRDAEPDAAADTAKASQEPHG